MHRRNAMEVAGRPNAGPPPALVAQGWADRWAEEHREGLTCWIAELSLRQRADLIGELCERCSQLFRRDPDAALSLAQAAVALARLTPAEGPEHKLIYDRRALAWASLANTHRIHGDLPAADGAWTTAKHLLHLGSHDVLLRARLLELEASLRRAQARYSEAIRLLRQAQHHYERKDRPAASARVGLVLANTLCRSGKPEDAIRLTLESIHGLDLQAEPALGHAAFHNLIACVAESGAVQIALFLMDEGYELYYLSPNPIDTLRGLWLRSRLCAALDQRDVAVLSFERVKKEFVALDLPYEAALASIELAVLLLKDNQLAKVKALAEEMYPVFVAQKIPREASAALLLFVEAARREAATVATVEHLLRELRGGLAPQARAAAGKFLT